MDDKHIYANQLFAGAVNYHNYIPTTSYNTDVKELEKSSIVEDMIQFFNRIRCRVPIDEEGNHEVVDIYLFSGDNENDEDIVGRFIEQFPGCKSIEVGLLRERLRPDITKRTNVEERTDRIITSVERQKPEKYGGMEVWQTAVGRKHHGVTA